MGKKNTPAVKKSSRWGNKWRPLKHSVTQRYAFPLKPPNYLPKNFFLNKSLINRDLLGNALRKGRRSLSICMPTSLTVAPAPFFVLLMFLLFSMSVFFKLSVQLRFHSVHLVLKPANLLIR